MCMTIHNTAELIKLPACTFHTQLMSPEVCIFPLSTAYDSGKELMKIGLGAGLVGNDRLISST